MTSDLDLTLSSILETVRHQIRADRFDETLSRLTFPMRSIGGEQVDIWIHTEGSKTWLSDGGETLFSLSTLGVDAAKNRKSLLSTIMAKYGVMLSGTELVTRERPVDELPASAFALAAAIVEVSSMYHSSQTWVESPLAKSVAKILTKKAVPFEQNLTVHGSSGSERHFAFRAGAQRPQSLIRTVSTADSSSATKSAELLMFHAQDVRMTTDSYRFVIVYDDRRITWSDQVLGQFDRYEIASVRASSPPELVNAVSY